MQERMLTIYNQDVVACGCPPALSNASRAERRSWSRASRANPKLAARSDRVLVLVDGRIARRVKGGSLHDVAELLACEEA